MPGTRRNHQRRPGRHRPGPHGRRTAVAWAALAVCGLLAVADSLRSGPDEVDAGGVPPQAVAQSRWDPAPVIEPGGPGFFSWAVLDRRTGRVIGSPNLTAPSDTMSMVKPWIAADYLRRTHDDGRTPDQDRLRLLTAMIRDSSNGATETVFGLVGGRASIERMISICQLPDSGPYRNWWSNTRVSARDTVLLGACLADGRAAGPKWTPWLLAQMRQVRGIGDFGVRAALPPAEARAVAIKNGWLLRDEDGLWHISCLAIGPDWTVGVLTRYPGRLGMRHGERLCQAVGRRLLTP